jgi:hypothetical protein
MTEPARAPNPFAAWLVAAAVAAGVLWASDLLMPPAAVAFAGHGERFQAMTLAPLSLAGEFPHRVLWPLLAHVLWLDGANAPIFSQVVSGALLAVVFWFARARGLTVLDAVLVTCGVAASGAVLVYKPMACLSDPLNFLLLLLALHHVRRPGLFWGLVLLSAFSHELSFFLAPWLVYVRCRAGGVWWREGLHLATIAAVYAGWLLVVRTLGSGGNYGIAYYLASNFWVPWGLPSLWAMGLLSILVEFGPLLAVLVWGARCDPLGSGRWGAWLLLASMLPMTLLAYDVMRFAALLVLALVPSACALLQRPRGRPVFFVLLVAAVSSYALTHPHASEEGGRAYRHVSGQFLDLAKRDLAHGVEPLGTFADGMAFSGELLARTWPVWLATLVGGGAVVAAGWWLRRYVGADGGSEPRTTQNASP